MFLGRKLKVLIPAAVVGVLAFAPAAHAFPVGPNAILFDGAYFELFVQPNTATPTTNDFLVTAQITTTASPTFTGVSAVNFKVANNSSKYAGAPSLVSAPNAGWTSPVFDNISNGGSLCNGSSPNGFVCSTGSLTVAPSTTYDWTFLVTLNNAADLLTGNDAADIRAYLTKNGRFLTIFSPDGTTLDTPTVPPTVPEPTTMVMFGSGLALTTLRRFRRA